MCDVEKDEVVEYGEEPDTTPETAEAQANSFEFADERPTESHEVEDEDFEGAVEHQVYAQEDVLEEPPDYPEEEFEDPDEDMPDCDDDDDCESEEEGVDPDEDDEDDYFGGDACEYCPEPVPGCEPGIYCPYED